MPLKNTNLFASFVDSLYYVGYKSGGHTRAAGGVVPHRPPIHTCIRTRLSGFGTGAKAASLHDCVDTLRTLWAGIVKQSMCHSRGLCYAGSLQGWRIQLLAIDLSRSCCASVLPAGLWLNLKFEKEWSNKHLEAGLRKRANDAAFDRETCEGWQSAFKSMQALVIDWSRTCCRLRESVARKSRACLPGYKSWRTDAW